MMLFSIQYDALLILQENQNDTDMDNSNKKLQPQNITSYT